MVFHTSWMKHFSLKFRNFKEPRQGLEEMLFGGEVRLSAIFEAFFPRAGLEQSLWRGEESKLNVVAAY